MVERPFMVRELSDRSLMVDPLSYFSLQLVLHDCCNKYRGMCYPVCGVVHIKEPLLLIGVHCDNDREMSIASFIVV